MQWYYQTSPHDTHDWDSTETPDPGGRASSAARCASWCCMPAATATTSPSTASPASTAGLRKFSDTVNWAKRDQREGAARARSGQGSTGSAYGGVSNPIYGTLTIGRQQSLELDAVSSYDPMGQAPGLGSGSAIPAARLEELDLRKPLAGIAPSNMSSAMVQPMQPPCIRRAGRTQPYLQRRVWGERRSDLERLLR